MSFPGKPDEPKPPRPLRKFDLLMVDDDTFTVEAHSINVSGQIVAFWVATDGPTDRLTYAVNASLVQTIEEQ
ncbi:hypothetical protein [Paeniglutamicibacter terrestris]|uniref:Uncharacterized protein n=1 Tax=Paeniglutamicibacter terrestris TaxID=2723403 RepID=A0ABX1G4B6_9MICC|nr:hypothetical protein [Paeniglutamicibacter terrestris]NKG21085.1 hypothetical protein [Paeniglutamicibacter terrestris]